MTLETRTGESGTRAHPIGERPAGNVARLRRRRSTYRGELGTIVSGQDTHGRRVRVFVADGGDITPDAVVANVKAGRRAFDSGQDHEQLREEFARARALGDTARIVELVTMMARQDYLTSTTYPRSSSPAHPESTLDTVPDHTQPEPPVLIPQHGSTGGRKPYNVRLRLDLVAEAMDRPEFAGKSLAQVIELALERLLP